MAITPQAGYELDPNNPNRVRKIGEQTTPDLGSISSANLGSTPSLNLPAVQPNASSNELLGTIDGSALSLDKILQSFNQPSAEEGLGGDLQNQIMQSLQTVSGRQQRTLEAEQQAGLPQTRTQLQDVIGQLTQLQAESRAIPLQIQQEFEGRGATRGGVAPIESGRLRENAIKSLTLSAIGQTLQGQIQTAQANIDRAIALEFEPEERKLAFLKQAYEFNKDALERVDKKRADNLNIILNERSRLLEEFKAQKEGIYKIMTSISQFGAPQSIVNSLRNAKSLDEAIAIASPYMQDPRAKVELQNAILDTSLKRAQIAKVQKETQLLGEPTKAEREATVKALQEAQSSIPAMQDKITAVGVLAKHPGMSSRVGTSIFDRGPLPAGQGGILGTLARTVIPGAQFSLVGAGLDTATGAGQDFAGGVHKLTSGLNLQELIEAKSRGATFGALSNQELRVLSSAASALSDWEIKRRQDGEDVPTGFWDIDEASFKRELDTIKNLTQRALERSGGKIITEDDQAIIDALYQVDSFNPAF